MHWYRLCVDLDHLGQPVGASVEVHDEDRKTLVEMLVLPDLVGPFDDPLLVFGRVVDEVCSRYGFTVQLFPLAPSSPPSNDAP